MNTPLLGVMPDLDTSTPTDQLMASLLLWVGSQERAHDG